MEVWKDIKGYEGLYQISNLGRVKSLKREANHRYGKRVVKEKIKIQTTKPDGYLMVMLSKGSKGCCKRVHRLVANTFIPNPENKREINHINCIKSDNYLDNLEWATSKENKSHAIQNGLNSSSKGERCANSKLTESQVLEIRSKYKKVRNRILAKEYGIHENNISLIMHRKSWAHI